MKAIVTGHTRGLGQAVAAALLGRGIPVLGLARSECPELAEQFPELLQQATLDLADPNALLSWLDGNVLDSYLEGATSVMLINNAGMLGPVTRLGRQEAGALVQAVSLNITAPLLLSNALARKYMGPLRIAHISSGAGRSAFAGWSIYGATKAALDHHARCAAADCLSRLRICSIAPGVIDTDMQATIRRTSAEDFPLLDRFLALKHQGELASPADAAERMVHHLLSEDFGKEAVADLRSLPSA
ncbi:MAG: SDR family oxidoreductase [Dechloromonas sp.]|nr:SDR family oxidoreductase [Dechloromonas sp.]